MDSKILFPNISGSPGSQPRIGDGAAPEIREKLDPAISSTQNSGDSFSQILGNELSSAIEAPLKFSAHATSRLQSRNLNIGTEQMRKLNEAVEKAAAKGLDDALILSSDAAFIVSVKNRTVITAMDRSSMEQNVFTNIDGAVII